MQGIEVTLKRNKQYVAENTEEYEVISGENNATTILVHFPEEYKDYFICHFEFSYKSTLLRSYNLKYYVKNDIIRLSNW